jgi:hypothetical protein
MFGRLALIALALVAAVLPTPAAPVERYYSRALFPVLQHGMTTLSNLASVAIIDVLIVCASAWLLADLAKTLISGWRMGWRRALPGWLGRLSVAASVVYLAFLMLWGLNYRRVPLVEKVPFDPGAASPERLIALATQTVDEMNRLYTSKGAGVMTRNDIDSTLARAFESAQRAIGVATPARPGRPKWSILDVYFKAAGVEGMTDPIFLETLVAGDLLPFERPFVIAHEWSHLAGFADEGEANFLGWLTCTRGSDEAAYSARQFLYGQLSLSLSPSDRKAIAARLDPGPRADLIASADRVRRNVRPAVANAGWQVYDRYLKANRIEAGTASYAEVVRLVLGVRLDPA